MGSARPKSRSLRSVAVVTPLVGAFHPFDSPAGQISAHDPPVRTAPGLQSASRNGVLGVGSVQDLLDGPEHVAHARSHLRQTPFACAYCPAGQLEMQWPTAGVL